MNSNPGIGLPASGTGNIPAFIATNTGSGPLVATVIATPAPSGLVYVANQNSQSLSVISIASGTVIRTIHVPIAPGVASVSPNGDQVYMTDPGSSLIGIYNTTTSATTTIASDAAPSGIAFSPDNQTAYVSSEGTNSVSVINAVWNLRSSSLNVGSSPRGVLLSPDGTLLYVPDYLSNSVSVANTAGNTLINTFATGSNPVGVAVSPDGSKLYVIDFGAQLLQVINASSGSLLASVNVGDKPNSIAISPDGTMLYVTNQFMNTLQVVSTATNKVIATVAVGTNPSGVAVSPDGKQVYVSNAGSNNVSIISATSNTVTTTVAVGNNPVIAANSVTSACSSAPVTFTITVNPASAVPDIEAGSATGYISACTGSASASPDIRQLVVSGSGLSGPITAAAPPDFEVSLTSVGGYSGQVSITPAGGTVKTTIVYVRSSASATGHISGNVILTSPGAANRSVTVTGIVNPMPGLNPPGNQTVVNGAVTTPVSFAGTANTIRWVNNTPAIGLPASGTGNIAAFTAVNTGSSPLIATITATPLSESYAYIANVNDNTVSVVDILTGKVKATIPVGYHPQGVAVTPDGAFAYITNSGGGTVSVISAVSNRQIASVPTGSNPIGIAMSPDGSKVYVIDQFDGTASVVSTATNTVTSKLSVGTRPMAAVVSPDGSRLYVTNSFPNTVSVINTATGALAATFPTGSFPTGITISPDGTRLYVSDYESNTISVINAATGSPLATIATGAYPSNPVLSPDGTLLYVANYGAGNVEVISTADNVALATIGVGNGPVGLSISPDGSTVYVTNSGSNTVSVINTVTRTLSSVIPVGGYPASLGGNFISRGSGCSGGPVSFTITVNAVAPVVTAGPVTGEIKACVGSPSAGPYLQQFSVSGSGLTAGLNITAPSGFEVSLSSVSGYANTLTIPETNGTINPVIIFVRSSAAAPAGPLSGSVSLNTAGADPLQVQVVAALSPLPVVNVVNNQQLTAGANTVAINFSGNGDNAYSWTNDHPEIGTAVSGTGNISSFATVNTTGKPITATFTVTPKAGSLAYIANFNDNTVSVVNTATNSVVKTIPVGLHPIAVALSPDGSRFYVANQPNTMSEINTLTNTVSATFSIPSNCYGMAFSRDGSKLYAAIDMLDEVLVINTANNTVMTTIGVGTSPEGVAVSPDGSLVYVANSMSSDISVISTATNKITATIPAGSEMTGVAFSPDGSTAYVTGGLSGSITTIDVKTSKIVNYLGLSAAAYFVAVSPDGSEVYFSNNGMGNSVQVMNTATGTITNTITVGPDATGLAFSPDGAYCYVAVGGSDIVAVISTATHSVVSTITVGGAPQSFGTFMAPGAGCDGNPVTFTIEVDPVVPPVITESGNIADLLTTYGTASSRGSFIVSGTGMKAGISVIAPPGFELSSDGTHFSGSLVVGAIGTIGPVTVYIRLSANTPVGKYSGQVMLTSAGAAEVDIPLNGTVNTVPLTITVADVSKTYGAILTGGDGFQAFTAYGLQNQETIGSITVIYGSGGAPGDPVGTYTGSVTSSAAEGGTFNPANYVITYSPANILVSAATLTIRADDQHKNFGEANSPLTAFYSGFVNGENTSVLTTLPQLSTDATTASSPGEYTIYVNGGSASNYTIVRQNGTLTVNQLGGMITIPNAFTPNGDGINDVWNIKALANFPQCMVSVYTRYGGLIFQSKGYGYPWDGTSHGQPLPTGTYYYIINLQDGHTPPLSGYVALVR